ncbi:MAG TPA: hypothetical protein VKU80_06685 [Planctomycetota bacterium]|nr:hypothetical protein [Planctomycetota bacterium]
MSDPQKPLSPGSRLRPAAGAPGAKGPRPSRPALPPPGPSASSMRLRKLLMLGIIFTCLGLAGAIGWRLWQKMHAQTRDSINVAEEFDKAMDIGKGASKDIFSIQTKVWGQGKELTPEDFATIKSKLAELRDCHDKLKDLLDLLHQRHLEDSADNATIVPKWLQVKMWILDASDLLENPKPPEYGGLNIPMFVTCEKIRKAQEELKDINTTKDEVVKRNDPEEIKKTRKKLMDLREAFRAHATKLQDLDKYVAEGLARPDLTNKDVLELEQLRDDANKAQMAVVAAGKMLQAFPE